MRKVRLSAPLPAKQKRSRETRDALLAAGWKLLANTSWDRLSVNDIVAEARSSVGSFYSRFADKDSYFDSLASQWLERRRTETGALYERLKCTDDYVDALTMDV
jgi:AcrR family transcriptional regulator